MALTAPARTVDALLEANYGTTLCAFLSVHRASGTSYRRIARVLYDLTDGVVDVTGETIRNWIRDLGLPLPTEREKEAAS